MAVSSDWERDSIKGGFLKSVERKFKLQKRQCRQLIAEVQEKERLQEAERKLRDEQLGKIIRALLLFEARLREEQKFIILQLEEKDRIIERQRLEIKHLMLGNANLIPYDDSSNSEYSLVTDYQTSNFDSYSSGSNNKNDVYFAKERQLSHSKSPQSTASSTHLNESQMKSGDHTTQNTNQNLKEEKSRISDVIAVFEDDPNQQGNDDWYASVSDQEDEEQRDAYKDNPVLECMNQILLQNVHDANQTTPPKTPQFPKKKPLTIKEKEEESDDYYETPIRRTPNVYETPQSFVNDYEQILNQCNETFNESSESHYYVDVDKKLEEGNFARKSKIQRTPPALPPKPYNLLSKHRIPNISGKDRKHDDDSESNYCSISEINLPTKNVKVVKPDKDNIPKPIQIPRKISPDIPKLPQVTEIIIPDETKENREHIGSDNYIKPDQQCVAPKAANRRPSIQMGSSVSSLIASFNSKQLLAEHDRSKHKAPVTKTPPDVEFDLSQNFEEFKLDECEFKDPPIKTSAEVPALDLHLLEKLQEKLALDRKLSDKEPSYEHFLECTGLSSKSILGVSKSRKMSKQKSGERGQKHSIKYWSAPYL